MNKKELSELKKQNEKDIERLKQKMEILKKDFKAFEASVLNKASEVIKEHDRRGEDE
jgi:uncharacterized coiled-coil protein SlyX